MLAAVVLVINLIFTIWAVLRSGVQNGLGTLQDGSCKSTTTLTFWIHLAINVLSTLLLGASNYSMQCLSSPTRNEIDKAHSQGIWLDIGVPSVRNLRRLSTFRIVLWWLLAISSIPLHLLYNSAVFSSLCTRQYNVFLVSSESLNGAPFDASTLADSNMADNSNFIMSAVESLNNASSTLQDYQSNQTSLVKLENKDCEELYGAQMVSAYSDFILVSTHSNSTNSLLYYDLGQVSQLLIDIDRYPSLVGGSGDFTFLKNSNANETHIQYCLSKRVEEHCKLQFSLAIMIVVIICNLIKTICMSIIAWKQDPEPLVTLGDAIASFLDRPDMTTGGNCIVGKSRFEGSRYWGLHLSRWDPKRLCWFRAASKRRWLVCNIL